MGEVQRGAVLIVVDPLRADKLSADRCPGEPDLAYGPETPVQVDDARGGQPVRGQGKTTRSDEQPGSAVQLAPDLGANEAHRALGAEPPVEEHVTSAAQAITIEGVLPAAVVPEFAIGGIELPTDLGVVEPDLTASGEAMVEV